MTSAPRTSPRLPPADFARRRSVARLAAVQALYQHATTNVSMPVLLREFHDYWTSGKEGVGLADVDPAFFDAIVAGVLARSDELDDTIRRFLERGWTLARLGRLMQQILRAGAWEMLARPDVPRTVVVTEYVDVADAFFDGPKVGFVNALLDRLGRDVRTDAGEKGAKDAKDAPDGNPSPQ